MINKKLRITIEIDPFGYLVLSVRVWVFFCLDSSIKIFNAKQG